MAVISAALGAPEAEDAPAAVAGLGTAALDDAATDAVGLAVTTEAGSGKLSSSSLRGLLLGEAVAYVTEALLG